MTKSDFYHRALLAVAPVVTQAYILKNNLPFAEDADDAHERLDERLDEMEAIADVADNLAMKLTAYWKHTDDFFKEEEEEGEEAPPTD